MKTTRLAPVLLCLALGAALLAFLPLISAASSLTWRAQPEAASSAPDWAALLDASSLVVRGQVVATQSQWDATHTAIESRHTVAVRYALLGAAPAQVQVRTPGGIVAAEGIGMFETAAPTLTDEEEVLLFLAPGEEGYVIAGGDGGKYTVEAGRLVNRRTLFAGAQAESYAALAATDARVTLPADWAAQEVAVGSETVVGGLDFVYNNLKWFTDTVDYRVNVNSVRADGDNGSRDDFLLAIRSAAERWTLVEEADFSLVYAGASESIDIGYNNANEVLFIDKGITDANGRNMPLAVARVFFMEADLRIVEADIWVNDAFAWDATGEPSGLEPDLQTVLTHEFGHWLALGHDADSRAVMFPTVMLGTTKRALYDNDRRGILFIYPCLTGEGACNPAPTATPTPTITPTPTPTLTPTPTATPTATPVPAGRTFAPHAGGVLTYTTSAGTAISLSVPAEAFAVTTTLAIEHAGVVGNPPQTEQRAVECFVVKFQEAGEASGPPPGVASFTVPMSLTVAYGEAALAGLDEATLVFYVYDVADEAWVEAGCGAAAYDAPANRVDVPICAPDTYGLFAARLPSVYLPAIRRD